MSRAFVKDTEDTEDLPDRPISGLPNDVTAEGFRRIEEALAAAQAAQAAAQAAGDRDALAAARRDVRYWSARRATAVVAGRRQVRRSVVRRDAVSLEKSRFLQANCDWHGPCLSINTRSAIERERIDC